MKTKKQPIMTVVCLVLIVLLAPVLMSCGTTAAPTTGVAAPTAAPASPVKLVIGLGTKCTNLDVQSNPANADFWVTGQVYDNLLWVDPETKQFVPGLATTWAASEDGLTYTFDLRSDVKYHDGTPFNAESVCANFARIMDPATKSSWAKQALGTYESCEILGDYKVAAHLSAPYGPFLESMAGNYVVMVSTTAAEKAGDQFYLKPVGTGPFMVKEFVLEDHVTLVRNPDYNWGPSFFPPGPAAVDELDFRFITEAEARIASLQTGETQMISEVPPHYVDQIQGNPAYKILTMTSPGISHIAQMNTERPPTDELPVRQAIAYAVDREAFTQGLYYSAYEPAYSILSSASRYYDTSKKCELYHYGAEKAKELLDGAGWTVGASGIREKNGKPLQVDYYVASVSQLRGEPSELLQAQLREVGIDMVIHELDRAAWYDAINAGNHNLSYWLFVNPGADILRGHFNSTFIGKSSNYSRFNNPEMDKLTDEVVQQSDFEKAKLLYDQIQCMAMENALVLTFWEVKVIMATDSNISGVTFVWTGLPRFQPVVVQ